MEPANVDAGLAWIVMLLILSLVIGTLGKRQE